MLEDLDNALPPVHQVAVRASVTGRCQDDTAVAETSEQLEATLPIGRVLSTVARADEHRAEAVPGPWAGLAASVAAFDVDVDVDVDVRCHTRRRAPDLALIDWAALAH